VLPAPARIAAEHIGRARRKFQREHLLAILGRRKRAKAHAARRGERDAAHELEVRNVAVPAERGAGAVLGDERVLELFRRDFEPSCDAPAQRLENARDGRRRAKRAVGEVVVEAETDRAALRGVVLVARFLEGQRGDRGDEIALLGGRQELGLVQKTGRAGRGGEKLLLLAAQLNAWIPVMARPRISAWMSCVPS
jgi:hypothetical protein